MKKIIKYSAIIILVAMLFVPFETVYAEEKTTEGGEKENIISNENQEEPGETPENPGGITKPSEDDTNHGISDIKPEDSKPGGNNPKPEVTPPASTESSLASNSVVSSESSSAFSSVVSSESSSAFSSVVSSESSSASSSMVSSESSSASSSVTSSESSTESDSSSQEESFVSDSSLSSETPESSESEVIQEDESSNDGKKFDKKFLVALIAGSVVILAAVSAGTIFIIKRKKKKIIFGDLDEIISDIIPLGPVYYPTGETWVTASSIVGTRSYQQDYVLTPYMKNIPEDMIEQKGCFCVLCDGMGGLEDGGLASKICAETLMNRFYSSGAENIEKIMYDAANEADERIYCLKKADGKPMKAGTTMTSVFIKDGKLVHSSVGDSRIYLCRQGEITQLSHDHNYFEDLVAGHPEGSPEWKEAFDNPRKEALTSYVGMGGLKHFDISKNEIELYRNDVVVMCSDGFYRSVDESEMSEIIQRYIDHLEFLPNVLTATAFDKGKIHQDNTSVITIKYLG